MPGAVGTLGSRIGVPSGMTGVPSQHNPPGPMSRAPGAVLTKEGD
jgi:hypothetical protein